MRKKLESQCPGGEGGHHDEPPQQTERHQTVGMRKPENGKVISAQRTYDERVGFFEAIGQQQGAQRRRNGECRDNGADDGVSIGLGHRREDVPFDAGQGEQRHKAGHDDEGGEQNCAIDLPDGECDGGEFSGESARGVQAGEWVGGVRPHRFGEASEYVLDQNDGCDHDKSKINGFADSPMKVRMMIAKESAKGMVAETTMALRKSPRNSHCTAKTRQTPRIRFLTTFSVVRPIRPERS